MRQEAERGAGPSTDSGAVRVRASQWSGPWSH